MKRCLWEGASVRSLSSLTGYSERVVEGCSCQNSYAGDYIDMGFEEHEGGRLANLIRDVPRAFYYAGVALGAGAKSVLQRF